MRSSLSLLFIRLNIPSSLSHLSSVFFSSHFISFVALFWTCSRNSNSSCSEGPQTVLEVQSHQSHWAHCWVMFSWLLTSTLRSFFAGQLSSHSSPSLCHCLGLLWSKCKPSAHTLVETLWDLTWSYLVSLQDSLPPSRLIVLPILVQLQTHWVLTESPHPAHWLKHKRQLVPPLSSEEHR